MKPRTYDFSMMVTTVVVLTAIGLICLYGIGYYTVANETVPRWLETPRHGQYINSMNLYIYPFLAVLVIVLGLCIPKRIVPGQWLLASGAGILGLTLFLALVANLEDSLCFLLGVSIVIQTPITVLTIVQWRGLTFEREGYVVQIGSTLLHLGIVIFMFDVVMMRTDNLHVPVFWLATILITTGITLSFYPREAGMILKYLLSLSSLSR